VAYTDPSLAVWMWRPDWSRPLIERLEWMTNVMPSYSGKEQRVALRSGPRQGFEFAFAAEGAERRRLENVLYAWGARTWALPVWSDGEIVSTPISVGSTSISCDTATRDFHDGGLGIVFSPGFSACELFEIDVASSGLVTLTSPMSGAWPAGSSVFPVRRARLEDRQLVSRFVADVAYGVARFEVDGAVPHVAAADPAEYRGHPVMAQRPEWSEDPELAYQRKLAEFDPRTGVRFLEDESGLPDTLQAYRWVLTSRAEIEAFRQFMYARSGRHRAIWIPTWTDDLLVRAAVSAVATEIDVVADGFTTYVDAGVHRRDIRVELADGTIFYRRITGAQVIDAATERLVIDASFGRVIQPAEFLHVSFMALCRLDQDSVELAWNTGEQADAVAVFRTMNNDV